MTMKRILTTIAILGISLSAIAEDTAKFGNVVATNGFIGSAAGLTDFPANVVQTNTTSYTNMQDRISILENNTLTSNSLVSATNNLWIQTTNLVTGTSNSLVSTINSATNGLWVQTTNLITGTSNSLVSTINLSTNGLWVQTTNLVTGTSNSLASTINSATNGLWVSTTNLVTGTSNSLVSTINSSTNGLWVQTTNLVTGSTNALWASTTNLVTGTSNSLVSTINSSTNSLWTQTTNLVTGTSNSLVSTINSATNGLWIQTTNLVTGSTNSLWISTTNLVAGTSNSLVSTINSATNSLWVSTTNLVTGTSNSLVSAINSATNGLWIQTTNLVTGTSNSLVSRIVAATNGITAAQVGAVATNDAKYLAAWQNPSSATNWTWTKTETEVTLTGYTGPNAVVIPDMLDGLPITRIASGVLNEKPITSVSGGGRVTNIALQAFYLCNNLTSISLPYVTTVGEAAFYGCTALTSVSLPSVVTIKPDAFSACAFTSISVPYATTIEANAFEGCANLTSISLPYVTTVGQAAFINCTSLTSITFGQNKPAEALDVFTGTPNVTNYVTNPTATGWGSTWNGQPVVRLSLYGNGTNITGITAAQVGAVSNTAAAIAAAGGVTNGQKIAAATNADWAAWAASATNAVTVTGSQSNLIAAAIQRGSYDDWVQSLRIGLASPAGDHYTLGSMPFNVLNWRGAGVEGQYYTVVTNIWTAWNADLLDNKHASAFVETNDARYLAALTNETDTLATVLARGNNAAGQSATNFANVSATGTVMAAGGLFHGANQVLTNEVDALSLSSVRVYRSGTWINVGTDSNAVVSAIANAIDGDYISIPCGRYNIGDRVSQAHNVVIAGSGCPNADESTSRTNGTLLVGKLSVNGNNTTVRDVAFSYMGSGDTMFALYKTNGLVYNVALYGATNNSSNAHGFFVWATASNTVIRDCLVRNVYTHGFVSKSTSVVFDRCVAQNCASGFIVKSDSQGTVSDNTIRNCRIIGRPPTEVDSVGITIQRVDGYNLSRVRVDGTVVFGSQSGIYIANGLGTNGTMADVELSGCDSVGAGYVGIGIGGESGANDRITNVVVRNCLASGTATGFRSFGGDAYFVDCTERTGDTWTNSVSARYVDINKSISSVLITNGSQNVRFGTTTNTGSITAGGGFYHGANQVLTNESDTLQTVVNRGSIATNNGVQFGGLLLDPQVGPGTDIMPTTDGYGLSIRDSSTNRALAVNPTTRTLFNIYNQQVIDFADDIDLYTNLTSTHRITAGGGFYGSAAGLTNFPSNVVQTNVTDVSFAGWRIWESGPYARFAPRPPREGAVLYETNGTTSVLVWNNDQRLLKDADGIEVVDFANDVEIRTNLTAAGSITAGGGFYGNGAGLTGIIGATTLRVVMVTNGTYSASVTNDYIRATDSVIVDLPNAQGSGKIFYIKNVGRGTVQVRRTGTNLIDGSTSQELAPKTAITVVDGATGSWDIL